MINRQIPLIMLMAILVNYGYAQTTQSSTSMDDSHKPNAKKGSTSTGTISVDPYTGIGSANVDIFTYSVDGVPLSVALSYNAKGIRIDEMSSSLGLGWDLQVGGSITREAKGLEDEIRTNAYWSAASDYFTGWLVPNARSRDYVDKYYDDKEADIFTLNLAGRSIELIFNSTTLTFDTYPKSRIKVQVQTKDWNAGTSSYTNVRNNVQDNIGANLDQNFLGFIVTDEKGNVFYFERGDIRIRDYKLSTSLINNTGNYWATEKWNLVKVVTYGGQEVKFEYVSKYVEYLETVSEKITSWDQTTLDKHILIEENFWKGYKSHVSKVIYPNNTVVTFGLDTNRADCIGNYRLQRIIVENKFDNNVKNNIRYVMVQGMLNSPAFGLTRKGYKDVLATNYNTTLLANIPAGPQQDSVRKAHLNRGLRLWLREVMKYGTDSTSTEPYYSFKYDTLNALPYRFLPHKDFYGYYNGTSVLPYIESSTSKVYPLSIPYPMPGSLGGQQAFGHGSVDDWGKDRSENSTYTPAYSLTKITNACGGSDSIVYKGDYLLTNPDSAYGNLKVTNTAVWTDPGYPAGPLADSIELGYAFDSKLQYVNVNDGLCIGKIVSRDGINNDNNVTTEYAYALGQRFNRGGYTIYKQNATDSVYTNFNVMPNIYFRGSNHGFSEVTITVKGYNNEQLSKSKYTFSNLVYKNANNKSVSCMSKPTLREFQYISPIMKKWRMGVVQKVESWDENGFLTSFNAYSYDTLTGYAMLLTKDSSVTYIRDLTASATKSMSTVTKYRYDANDNLKVITAVNSKGDTLKTYRFFNYDYPGTLGTAISSMNSNSLQFLVATYNWKRTPTDSTLLSVSFKTPRYYTAGSISRLKFFAAFNSDILIPLTALQVFPTSGESQYVPKTVLGYTGTQWPSTTANNLEKSMEITRYDTSGNAIEVMGTQINENKSVLTNEYNSSIWDTYNGNQIAEVSNAMYKNIAYTSFEGSYYGVGVSDYNKGNWDFTPSSIKYYSSTAIPGAITGKYFYEVTSSTSIVGKPLENRKYKLSFWVSDSTKKPFVRLYNGATLASTLTYPNSSTQVGNWVLYTFNFTPPANQHVRIITGGSNVYIDEVRLHPRDAMMTTSTFAPLLGKISETDENNYIIYYSYDLFGVLKDIKDMRGNIVQTMFSKCLWNDTDSSPNYDPDAPQNPSY